MLKEVIMPLVSALIGAAAGGGASFVVARKGEQRNQRVSFLLSAYRALITAANRREGLTPDQARELERALTDVMLLGRPEEIEAARQLMVDLANGLPGDLVPLISELRDSLRDQLGLEASPLPKPFNLTIQLRGSALPGARATRQEDSPRWQ